MKILNHKQMKKKLTLFLKRKTSNLKILKLKTVSALDYIKLEEENLVEITNG